MANLNLDLQNTKEGLVVHIDTDTPLGERTFSFVLTYPQIALATLGGALLHPRLQGTKRNAVYAGLGLAGGMVSKALYKSASEAYKAKAAARQRWWSQRQTNRDIRIAS